MPEPTEPPAPAPLMPVVSQRELDAYCALQSRTSYSVTDLSAEDRAAILAARAP